MAVAAATQPLDNKTVRMQTGAEKGAKATSKIKQLKIFGTRAGKGILASAIGYPVFTGVSTYLDFKEGAKKHASFKDPKSTVVTSDIKSPSLKSQSTKALKIKTKGSEPMINTIKLKGFAEASLAEMQKNAGA